MFDVNKTREDFKILRENKDLIYFDNACVSLKPDSVVSGVLRYYDKYQVCGMRSSHKLSNKLDKEILQVRKLITDFINAKSQSEIIFTKNTTESINLVSHSFPFKKGDIILLSDKEHNSNLIPWLSLRDRIGVEIKILPSLIDNTFDLKEFENQVKGVRVVSVNHISNLDGMENPISDIIKIAHKNGALVLLDCAQSLLHRRIDVSKLDVDFIAFSGHKILGPSGMGVLYGKKELLEKLNPFIAGGGTTFSSTYLDYENLELPYKLEGGLQDYAGILGLGEAINYLNKLNFEEIEKHELKLNTLLTEELKKHPQIKIIGNIDPKLRSSIVSFYIENKDMHQVGIMLDEMDNIAVRVGQFCVHSYFNAKRIKNALRISFSFYNTEEEVLKFIKSLDKILKII